MVTPVMLQVTGSWSWFRVNSSSQGPVSSTYPSPQFLVTVLGAS